MIFHATQCDTFLPCIPSYAFSTQCASSWACYRCPFPTYKIKIIDKNECNLNSAKRGQQHATTWNPIFEYQKQQLLLHLFIRRGQNLNSLLLLQFLSETDVYSSKEPKNSLKVRGRDYPSFSFTW